MNKQVYEGAEPASKVGVMATNPAANGPTKSRSGKALSQRDRGVGPVVYFAST